MILLSSSLTIQPAGRNRRTPVPCSNPLEIAYIEEPTQQRAGYFYLKGKLQICCEALRRSLAPGKSAGFQSICWWETQSRRGVREKKRHAADCAAGFAVRLLELVDEWEGSGCSLEPEKQNILCRACGGTQWILSLSEGKKSPHII